MTNTTHTQNKFEYFPNHGDEDGRNGYTISYGDANESDNIIVGCEDTEESAIEAVKRLNEILQLHHVEQLSSSVTPDVSDEAIFERVERLKPAKYRHVCFLNAIAVRNLLLPTIARLEEENKRLVVDQKSFAVEFLEYYSRQMNTEEGRDDFENKSIEEIADSFSNARNYAIIKALDTTNPTEEQ